MLDNPIKRESVKAVGVGAAILAGGPVAAILAASLGVAVEALGYLGEKRTKELFDTTAFLDEVITEIRRSDDFASFVYDIWMKHNFESSEARRKRLKAILLHAVESKDKDFENFTRIITAAQQINDFQIRVLSAFYEDVADKGTMEDGGSVRLDGQWVDDYKASSQSLGEVLQEKKIVYASDGGDGLTPTLNQLCYLGLVGTYAAMDGEYYMPTSLGKIFLEYIKASD
jgi:hypothetical protein